MAQHHRDESPSRQPRVAGTLRSRSFLVSLAALAPDGFRRDIAGGLAPDGFRR